MVGFSNQILIRKVGSGSTSGVKVPDPDVDPAKKRSGSGSTTQTVNRFEPQALPISLDKM
jgi:hypothetical protein